MKTVKYYAVILFVLLALLFVSMSSISASTPTPYKTPSRRATHLYCCATHPKVPAKADVQSTYQPLYGIIRINYK